MININCVLADTINKIRIAEKYGTCTDELLELLCYLSGYQWAYNNAWDCITDVQKKDVEVFLRTNFNCTSFVSCEQSTEECADTPAPLNDDCSGAFQMGYPSTIRPTSEVLDQTNTFTCGVVDYPTDSGITYPDSWDVDSSGDVWYYFDTSTSNILNPYITIVGGTMTYPQFAIYEGPTCGGLGFVKDAENLTSQSNYTQLTLDPSTRYFLRISNGGGNANTGTFTITISLYPIV